MTHAVLDRDDLQRTLVRIAHEIVERNGDEPVALVGIHTRGALMARRLRALIEELLGRPVPLGEIDISFYRDDVGARRPAAQPVVHSSRIDFPLEETTVVLVDDVLYTGRTARAGDRGALRLRPARPACSSRCSSTAATGSFRSGPTTSGKNLPTSRSERVNVRLEEHDGVDEVEIAEAQEVTGLKHLLSIADLERADIERILDDRRELRRGRRSRHQEGARPFAAARS